MTERVIQITPCAPGFVLLRCTEDGFWEDPVMALALVHDYDADGTYDIIRPLTGGEYIDTLDDAWLTCLHASVLAEPDVRSTWEEIGKRSWSDAHMPKPPSEAAETART